MQKSTSRAALKYTFFSLALIVALWENTSPLIEESGYSSLFDNSKFGHMNKNILEAIFLASFTVFFYKHLRIQKLNVDFKTIYFLVLIVINAGLTASILVKKDVAGFRFLTYAFIVVSMAVIDIIHIAAKNEEKKEDEEYTDPLFT